MRYKSQFKSWQAEVLRRANVSVQVKGRKKSSSQAGGVSLNAERVNIFVLSRSSNDWMRPIHITKHNLFYSVC